MINIPHKLLGKRLRKLRKRRALRLREVGKKVGVSNGHICQIENGLIKNPSVFIIKKLAMFYRVQLSFLLWGLH